MDGWVHSSEAFMSGEEDSWYTMRHARWQRITECHHDFRSVEMFPVVGVIMLHKLRASRSRSSALSAAL
jgi:hypothetical protein